MVSATHKKLSTTELFFRILMITIGSLLMALSLKMIIIPADIIDGGIVGISLMISHIVGIPLGVLLFVLNLPFVILGYKQIGKTFAFSTFYGIIVMSTGTFLLKNITPATTDPFLASIFGGIAIGVGVGLVIKYGGALDGTEIVAILINKKTGFSIGQIILFINIIIFTVAAFVYGLENALYSMISYYIAFKAIDLTVEGLQDMKSLMIITEKEEEIAEAIMNRLGRGITYLNGEGGYDGTKKKIIYVVITRLEEAKLKHLVAEIDEKAFMAITNIADVRGGEFKKKDIH
jgi:uncharacterized membrane-anchored protein YitT (DUF2179 family)